MKDFFFQHDYNARSDLKIQALIEEFTCSGYGIYWGIVEVLHQEENHKLPKKDYIYKAIAKQMKASAEQVKSLVEFCINECELFKSNETHFWSERVLRNMEKRKKISEIRSEIGKKGAKAKQLLSKSPAKSSKEKKKKEKKKKEKETTTKLVRDNPPTFEEWTEYCKVKGYSGIANKTYEYYQNMNWEDSQGNPLKNWKSKLLANWFKADNKDKQSDLFTQTCHICGKPIKDFKSKLEGKSFCRQECYNEGKELLRKGKL